MAKRRGNCEGSIYQRANSTWRGQVSLRGKRLCFSAKTRKEVQDWIKKTIAQIDNGLTIQGANMILKEYLQKWLVSLETNLRPGTYYQYELTCRHHIIPTLGNLRLKDITPIHIQQLYILKGKQGSGARTIKVMHVVLHKSLKQAMRLGIIGRNPVDMVDTPRYQPKEILIYTEDQVNQLLLAIRGDRMEGLINLALVAGCRLSELLALKWSDLDFKLRTLHIQRQLTRFPQKEDYFVPLKTKAGNRTIDLGERTIDLLQEHYFKQQVERQQAYRWVEHDLIFPSTCGTPQDQYNVSHAFKKLIKCIGLPDIHFHTLRHQCASLLIGHGVSPVIVAHRLGHSKVSITMSTYAHLIGNSQYRTGELIDGLVMPVQVDLHQTAPQLHQTDENGSRGSELTPQM